jgi:hypothetical protein
MDLGIISSWFGGVPSQQRDRSGFWQSFSEKRVCPYN